MDRFSENLDLIIFIELVVAGDNLVWTEVRVHGGFEFSGVGWERREVEDYCNDGTDLIKVPMEALEIGGRWICMFGKLQGEGFSFWKKLAE